MKLHPADKNYPRRLRALERPPILTTSGPLEAERVVAIVGSRDASKRGNAFAEELAAQLARAGVTIVSGGAVGIDQSAHAGALRARGATWLVSPAGRGVIYPATPKTIALHHTLEHSRRSRMIWPFFDGREMSKATPRFRNGVLVGLAECVVVIEAGPKSGSLNAANWAKQLDRRTFFVPGPPWEHRFRGANRRIMEGSTPLWTVRMLFDFLGLPPPARNKKEKGLCDIVTQPVLISGRPTRRLTYGDPPRLSGDSGPWTPEENLVFSKLSAGLTQQEDLVEKTGLAPAAASTALLTLSLKDVVVEGPDGFFRRRTAR